MSSVKSWCRLCAKENGNEINLFFKLESTAMDVSNLIGKYLNISVSNAPLILMSVNAAFSPQPPTLYRSNRKTIFRQQFAVIATPLYTI